MLRRYVVISIVAALLMAPLCFAQSPRQPTSSEGKTTFTNIAVTGLDKAGTADDGVYVVGIPGYIEMTSTIGTTFYLYIDSEDNLRIASDIAVGQSASPAIIGWLDASGIIVGSQSYP